MMMPLATLAELKARLNISGTGDDTALTAVLNTVSSEIEAYLNRTLVSDGTAVTEYFGGFGGSELLVKQWPIVAVSAVIEDGTGLFNPGTSLTEGEGYVILHAARGRIVRYPFGLIWARGPRTVQVTYTGGYYDPASESPPTGFSPVPQHIQDAALLQATYLWGRRKELGSSSESFGQVGQVSHTGQYKLLDAVKALLRKERRHVA